MIRALDSTYNLTVLANHCGSDKGTTGVDAHGYTLFYDLLLAPRRTQVSRMLEIGLLRGGPEVGVAADRATGSVPSIEMWLAYFPKAMVHGFDISDFSFFRHPRFAFTRGDSGSAEDLKRLTAAGERYDLILDDGSHASFHQQLALSTLFGALNPGGLYIIEDLHWQSPHYEDNLPPTVKTADLVGHWFRHGTFPHVGAPELSGLSEVADEIGYAFLHEQPFFAERRVKIAVLQKKLCARPEREKFFSFGACMKLAGKRIRSIAQASSFTYDQDQTSQALSKKVPLYSADETLVVESFYREILSRAPDPGGFETYAGLARRLGIPRAVKEMLRSFLSSKEFLSRLDFKAHARLAEMLVPHRSEYRAKGGSYNSRGTEASVMFIQTSDPFKYNPMLMETSQTVAAYCAKHGFGYESFIGYKRGGKYGWHATYNRIPMLSELLERGRTGWVVYMDADAYIADAEFDLMSYLSDKASLAMIFTQGADLGWWDVNAGVFMINLDSQQARTVIARWSEIFRCIPDEYFQLDTAWSESFPDDQQMLQSILQEDWFDRTTVRIESHAFINSPSASFIRTCMRVDRDGQLEERLEERLALIRKDVASIDSTYLRQEKNAVSTDCQGLPT